MASPPSSFRRGTSSAASPSKRHSSGTSAGRSVGRPRSPSSSSSSGIPSSIDGGLRRKSSSRPSSSPISLDRPPAPPLHPPPDFVQAAYNFHQAADPTYLAFRKGQLIRVIAKDASGWWNGDLEGRQGWFPSTYVLTLDGPASLDMIRRVSSASSASATSLSMSSSDWDRRPSDTSSVTSSSSDSYSAYGLQRPQDPQDKSATPPRSASRQSAARSRRSSEVGSPPRTVRRPSELKTPSRPLGSRLGVSTRGTEAILESITTAVSLLHNAVAAERISHFQPSTACVISSVRSVLSATDCLPRDSPLLKLHPALARERKQILTELSKLVSQARLASAAAMPDDSTREAEMEKMLSMARRLLAGVKAFLAIAVESAVDPPDEFSAAEVVDGSKKGRAHESQDHPRAAGLFAGPSLDLDRTPTAADSKREPMVQPGTVSGRRLMEVVARSHPPTPSPVVESRTSTRGGSSKRTTRTSLSPADSLAGEAKIAHEELVNITSAFIGQFYAPSTSEVPTVVAHLLEVVQKCLLRVIRILVVVDQLCARTPITDGLSDLLAARREAFVAGGAFVVAAEELGTAVESGGSDGADDATRIKLLGGATNTLRTAAAASQLVGQHAASALGAALADVSSASDSSQIDDVELLRQRCAALVTLRDRLVKVRTPAAHVAFPRALALNRHSADSISLAPTGRSESGEDLTIRATLPLWTEATSFDDEDLVKEVAVQPVRPQSATCILGTEASLSLSTKTASTDATLPSPRSSEDDLALDTQPLVRTASTSSLEQESASEHPKLAAAVLPQTTGFSLGVPMRPRAATLVSSPRTRLKLSDPPLDVPTPRYDASRGQLRIFEHDYDPTDLALGPEGNLMGVSLPALVEKLTPHDTSIVDPALLSMFFLCFRLFTKPIELFEVLLQRFTMDRTSDATAQRHDFAAWMENKVGPVRVRVYSFFKMWLDMHWRHETDAEALPLIEAFAEGLLKEALPSVAPRLLRAARLRSQPMSPKQRPPVARLGPTLHKAKSTDRLRSVIPLRENNAPRQTLPPTPQINRSLFQALRNPTAAIAITDFDPLELARQLTVMEAKLFNMVKAQDVLESVRRSSPALKSMSNFNTQLTSLVSDTILTERDIKKRAVIVKFFIKLANRLLDQKNLSGSFAVVAALNSSSIQRLHRTWDALSNKAKLSIAALRELFDSSRNHANYRARLRECAPPALPFLGLILTDITFCHDGHPSTRAFSPSSPDKHLINLVKYNALYKIVSDMQRYQVPFALAEVPEVQIFLSKAFAEKESTSADNLYRKSLSVEPRTSTTFAP